jgi:hypothetical protein
VCESERERERVCERGERKKERERGGAGGGEEIVFNNDGSVFAFFLTKKRFVVMFRLW